MFSDKAFQIALLVSVLTHGAILLNRSGLNILPKNISPQKIEVSYIKRQERPRQQPKIPLHKQEPLKKLPAKITLDNKTPPPFINKDDIFKGINKSILSGPSVTKPAVVRPDVIAIKKKITLPPVDMDKINNASYINYYQIVREKIRRSAYQNYARTEIGEVYLTFVVSAEGLLKGVNLVEEKSSSSKYLKEVALRSIREAAPFPHFPKELDYPQLTFNVVISFEVE